MADYTQVTYTYYTETLGRAVVPNEQEFNALKLPNVQTMKHYEEIGVVEELENNGIISAVCMMIEAEYSNNQLKQGESPSSIASESLGGHSVSYGSSALNKQVELDAQSLDAQKIGAIKLFCRLNIGV